jgi:NTP pyrophosphatase (non-canonical NTP hydrolase)
MSKSKMTIAELIKQCHSTARQKGWWETQRNHGELIALMHSELSEALEAMRKNGTRDEIAEELADCCIRIFDYCGAYDIDLGETLVKKMEFNKTRPHRHGKKF